MGEIQQLVGPQRRKREVIVDLNSRRRVNSDVGAAQ